jgi:phosphoribosylanthranilate isomerase
MLKTITKISTVTNLSDARYCAGMGVDMLGFCVDKTQESYVSPAKFKEITGWLAGIQTVIESTSDDVDYLVSMVEEYNPIFLQIAHAEVIKSVLNRVNVLFILKIEADQDADNIDGLIHKHQSVVRYFLIESTTEADFSGDWSMFLKQLSPYPILLGFGIEINNINDILAECTPTGIALKGSQETRPGFKDYGKLMDILEVLEEE